MMPDQMRSFRIAGERQPISDPAMPQRFNVQNYNNFTNMNPL